MHAERRQLIESLFESAGRLPAAGRPAFLDEACARDSSLRLEVELLLTLENEAQDFLESPALQLQSAMFQREQAVVHAPGDRVGPYEIRAIVGSGGMGEVYKAHDPRLGRDVAIKFIPLRLAEDARAVERFKREARAASALNHRNICSIFDIGEHHGQPYLVMELLQGSTLKEQLSEGPLPAGQLADVAQQMAGALEAAHTKGIVHRDIKPANVFLNCDGLVKILDFGIAKLVAEPRGAADALDADDRMSIDDTITLPGMLMGTAAYMSPEQIRGGAADGRSDLFSLGVVLYQAATGGLPFRGDNVAAIRAAILNEPPIAPRKVNAKINRELERIILKAIEKDPGRRYQRARDLGSDLAQWKQRLAAAGRRRTISVSAIACATLAVTGALAVWIFGAPNPPIIRLRQITSDSELKSWPVLSDGSRIYYLSQTCVGPVTRAPSAQGCDVMAQNIAQIPVSGGRSTPLQIPFPGEHVHLFDLSPDGQELLIRAGKGYSEAGPLWRLRISDGFARLVVPNHVLTARYSPDGKRVVWSTGKRLYVGALDGSGAREIASRSDGDLTLLYWTRPDRIALSFRKERIVTPYAWGWGGFGGSSAWQIAPDGSGFRRMLPAWDREHDFAGFTSGGRAMLLLSKGELWTSPAPRFPPLTLGGRTMQIAIPTLTLFVPHQTRNGRLFTVGDVRLGELQRYNAATRTWERHLDGRPADAVEYSRDRRWVVYVRYPEQSLLRCRADGTECLQLVDGQFGPYLPHWSPDNRTIAFQARAGGNPWRIWLINLDGSGLRLAAPSYAEDQCDATWTGDGKGIIFGSGFVWPSSPETVSLHMVDVQSANVTLMPGTKGLWNPNNSWDGSRLLALTLVGSPPHPAVSILAPATGRWTTANEESALFPIWARDGKSVIYYHNGQIRRFRLDTWRAETIAPFDRWQAITGNLRREWVGLDYDGAVLVMRNLDVRQIYELESVTR